MHPTLHSLTESPPRKLSGSVINMVQRVMAWFCHERQWHNSSSLWRSVPFLQFCTFWHLHSVALVKVRLVISFDTFMQISVPRHLHVYCLALVIWLMMSVMNLKVYLLLNKGLDTVRCVKMRPWHKQSDIKPIAMWRVKAILAMEKMKTAG